MSTPALHGRIERGQYVRVHVNLHKQQLAVADPRTARVLCYVHDITLTDVEFRHQPGCVARIRRQQRRAVCAYARGRVAAVDTHPPASGRRVRYNPFHRPDFHLADTDEPITAADLVLFTELRAYLL